MTRPQATTARYAKALADWRPALLLSVGMLAASALMLRAESEIIESHGYSYFGDLSYPEDYTHFNYVNPDAPKGGEISIAVAGTFDSMNPYTRKGRAAALATVGYESLLGSVLAGSGALPADVDGEYYGLLAHKLEYPTDKSWVIFHMRPEAKFSDGSPVTAHDIAFSHNLLLDQGLKSYADAVRKRIPKVEVLDDHTIKFYFAEGISRRSLIDQVGFVPAWSKKWYEESGARLDESRLEISPGSGPYMVESVDVNRRVTYKRHPDYWGHIDQLFRCIRQAGRCRTDHCRILPGGIRRGLSSPFCPGPGVFSGADPQEPVHGPAVRRCLRSGSHLVAQEHSRGRPRVGHGLI